MGRLLLVRHASTRATRRACFAPEDPLDAHGRTQAAALRAEVRGDARFLVAPCLAAFQTASLAGCAPLVVEHAIAECDYGRWAGRALDDVRDEQPDGVEVWLADPDAVPHGGESMRALLARIGDWLDGEAASEGTVVAVMAGAVVRAAVVRALDAPAEALWRLDVSPASVTELHARDGRWTVTRVNDRRATRAAAATATATAAAGGAADAQA
jgi:broad specificity phosphatase PhoE